MSSQVHYFDLSFPAQQGDQDSFVEVEQKVLCCTAAPSYKAWALCIEPLSIPWHSFPCSSLIPWTFLHFQNLTDGTFTLFSVSSSFQDSFFFQEPFILTPTFPSKTPNLKFSPHQYLMCWSTTSASYVGVLPPIFLLMYQTLFGPGVTEIYKQLIVVAAVSSRLLPESSKHSLGCAISRNYTKFSLFCRGLTLQMEDTAQITQTKILYFDTSRQ